MAEAVGSDIMVGEEKAFGNELGDSTSFLFFYPECLSPGVEVSMPQR